jgi:putative glycerol-1-phosphate prenyltransferase
MGSILEGIVSASRSGRKLFALLIDPDKFSPRAITAAHRAKADLLLVGGSHITNGNFERCIASLRRSSKIPVVIFPGNAFQVSSKADGILFLSLISGRNPDLLIGQHVLAAPVLKKSRLEIIPTGYMLIDGGRTSSAAYISHTLPIPADKTDIAVSTAVAGELLGLRLLYLEAGSGARFPVSAALIREVKKNVRVPVIAGGGIRTPAAARKACAAGADVIVVGNAAEKNASVITAIASAVHRFNRNMS